MAENKKAKQADGTSAKKQAYYLDLPASKIKMGPEAARLELGFMNENGERSSGRMYVGIGKYNIQESKATRDKPDDQKRYYVNLKPDATYQIYKKGGVVEQMTGSDVVAQNRAFMKDYRERRTKAINAEMDNGMEAEKETQLGE